MKYKRRNKKILIFLGLVICLMTAAYAAFYSELNITGTSNITNSWDVEITDVSVGTTTGSAKNVSTPSWDALTASMEADIYESGDSVSYNVTVSNLGTLDAKLDDITKNIKSNNEAVKITFSGYSKGERLYKKGQTGSTKTITVTISYNDDYEGELNYNTSTETNVTFNYVQAQGNNEDPENPIPTTYLLTYDYSTNGGSGTTSDDEYYDANTEVTLSGEATKKGYTFVGWNTDKDATSGLSKVTLDNDKTVYAIYKKEAITLTAKWNANNATLATTTDKTCTIPAVYNNATQGTSCTVDAPTITAPANTPTILGFNTSANSNSNNEAYNTSTHKLTLTIENNNKTWYAQTTKTKVDGKVTFNPNGNTKFTYNSTDYTATTAIKICDIAATYNGAAQATTCKATITMPTITAHSNTTTIIGWSTAANTHTATYNSGQTNVELTSGSTYYAQTSSGAATTLTAKWNANGATLSATTDKTCTIATTYNGTAKVTNCTVDAPTITRDGFTITGFNDSASATTNNSSYNASTKN